MEALCYDSLSFEERMALNALAEQPGYPVFKKLIEDACMQATARAISTDPEDPDYDKKLKARQLVARVTNDVCATIIKSIEMHRQAGLAQQEAQNLQKVLEEVVGVEEPNVQFGSMKTKKKSPSQKTGKEAV